MIDADLSELYRVPTKALNQAVKRNRERFPDGFMFRLTAQEASELVTICDRFAPLKHASSPPFAFTEYGVAMLSSVLRSPRAVRINIRIIQTFIRLRELAFSNTELSRNLEELERKVQGHDFDIQEILRSIRRMAAVPEKRKTAIGFNPSRK